MIKFNKLTTAIALVLGTTAAGSAMATGLAAGDYTMTIRETPELYAPGSGVADVGCDAAGVCSNSSFTFGGFPSQSQSQRLSDNGVTVAGFGGVGGDGAAGVINFTVNADSSLSFTSGSVDVIQGTAAKNFAQDLNVTSWSGSVGADGSITFAPTDRLGYVDGAPISGARWNIDDFTDTTNTAWTPFTTGTAAGPAGDITGSALDAAHSAVLVSSSFVGSDWGTFFGGTEYEVWAVDITAVPVPAAVWLFGSGLVGLVGVARRRNKKA